MSKILTFGVYDYFHLGHLRLFKQCKQYADYLIVAMQDGNSILKFKPEAKVFYSTEERKEMLEAIKYIDEVIVYDSLTPQFLETVDFDILALGEDHIGGRFDIAKDWCIEHGKSVVRLKRTEGISSTAIKESLERVK